MTRKQLTDYCNEFWGKKGYCNDCEYMNTYCRQYCDKYSDTPYREQIYRPELYTDEEIVLEKNK